MLLLDVPEACVPYADLASDIAVSEFHRRTQKIERSFEQAGPCSTLMTAPATMLPLDPSLGAARISLAVEAPVEKYSVADLVKGETPPETALKEMLRVERRPAGLRELCEAMVAMRQQMPGGKLTPVAAEDLARLERLERAALAAATPTELALTLKEMVEKPAVVSVSGSLIPRKRDLTGNGLETRLAAIPAVLQPRASAQAVNMDAYARVMLDLGRMYSDFGNLPATFQLLSNAMRTSYDVWLEQAAQLKEPFMKASVFQALSGQKASEVVAVFTEFPLDRQDLSRRIVAQIDRRLSAYAGANRHYIREPDLAAALGDLLHTMVEDPEFIRLVDKHDYRNILERIAKVALEREFHTEALGALSAIGDEKQLVVLGRRWSKDVVKKVGEHWIVNRDIELAIVAYTEAREFTALKELLGRCRKAKAMASNEGPVEGSIHLDRYIERLSNMLEGDAVPLTLSR